MFHLKAQNMLKLTLRHLALMPTSQLIYLPLKNILLQEANKHIRSKNLLLQELMNCI